MLPDLLGTDIRLLFVGINPGLRTIAVQAHFGGGSNRFYPALYRAGIVDRRINASSGFAADDVAHLRERGIGITNLVRGASARADELTGPALRGSPDSLRTFATQNWMSAASRTRPPKTATARSTSVAMSRAGRSVS
ncbi:uracil-DNA glycosylase family protein [Leifsonia sp. Root112D2]|uniref:uracil-DNA glycosylase family protein n=1 Tax=Leifsonia sp. Root112D2 TaxID=1736426 RepID=UPI001F34B33A|nr:uracil-DNA glycosylase family protein [Leifsonia sp. Root112D2]